MRRLGARGAGHEGRRARGARRVAQAGTQGREVDERHSAGRGTGQPRRAAWACCWAVGCAFCALSLFLTRFDSILFLSQFLDIVRKPGS